MEMVVTSICKLLKKRELIYIDMGDLRKRVPSYILNIFVHLYSVSYFELIRAIKGKLGHLCINSRSNLDFS